MNTELKRATLADLDALAPLFASYRVFYGQPRDEQAARRFLSERLQRIESVIFIAWHDGAATGFTQLYPSFSSTRIARTWILNDLYVQESARRKGIASSLLQTAEKFARDDGAARLELETDHDNHTAQALYRALGWQVYEGTLRFRLHLHD